MPRIRALTAAVASVGAGAALLLCSGPAQADPIGTVGVRETVCAQTLYVRTAAGGPWMGTLTAGQTFTVESTRPGWDYGFAYGDINRHGWVQAGWFC